MSRFFARYGKKYIEEIESMEFCRWRVDGVCCNSECDARGDYPYPHSICELEEDGQNHSCGCFEKEDGIIGGTNE